MKTKYILPIALVLVPTMGVVMTFSGTWLPRVDSQQTYGYSPETYALQENYDYAVSASETAYNTRVLAEQAFNEALKAESAAKQSLCALRISLGNSKLKDVGDKDPSEATRLTASVAEGAECLLLNSPAFK